MHFGAVFQGLRRGSQAGQLHVPDKSRKERARMGQNVSAFQIGHFQAVQIHGGALSGPGRAGSRAMHLQAANSGIPSGGVDIICIRFFSSSLLNSL